MQKKKPTKVVSIKKKPPMKSGKTKSVMKKY